ncbi:MAG TPA: ATP synthase F1 subunit gamma [Ignavibacteria bacterium]|nr:ATP synthase F1 subunit gamma [Ignavibacteria bacterium]
MATVKEIRNRIKSIQSTEKITRAMKMVASVKFRKAQQNVVSARPYAKKLNNILKNLIPSLEEFDNELLKEREVKKICLVVVSSDRGLCGSFNTNLIKHAANTIIEKYGEYSGNHNLTLITIGKKAYDFFYKRHYDIYARYINVFDKLEFSAAEKIINEIIKGYIEKKFDKVVVIYNEFKSVVQSKIVEDQLLPIAAFEDSTGSIGNIANYIYEPTSNEIVNALLPRHLNTQMWQVMLESYASEQAARMTAMDSATTNANDLVRELNLTYNRARQAAITKELLEVVAGAEALSESN